MLLQHAQNNIRSTAIHLVFMSSNSTIVACILVNYIFIFGIFLLSFYSIFTRIFICKRERRRQPMLYLSVFKSLCKCAFLLSVNKLFISYYAKCLRNNAYLGSWSSFQWNKLYTRKVFTSLEARKYVKTQFSQS